MSRILEALRKARQNPTGAVQHLPNVEEIIAVGSQQAPVATATEAVGTVAAALPVPEIPTHAFLTAEDRPLVLSCRQYDWPKSPERLSFLNEDAEISGKEQFRTLRSLLYQVRARGELKVIAVSSAIPGEGKSFVSANLAHAFSLQSTRKALLIDADVRKFTGLSGMLDAPSAPGLTDYLLGECQVEDIIQVGTLPRMYLIPAGRRVPQPGELIGDPKFPILLEQLKPLFDWIVIDTPPVLPTADARVIADLSDGVLLVVNSKGTHADLARRAALEFQHDSLLGVVLNRATDPSATRYPAYGYGYGYGYENAG